MDNFIQKIKKIINIKKLDSFIIFNNEYDNRANVQYLSDFTGSYCILILTNKDQYIITDSRYYIQAQEETNFKLIKQKAREHWSLLKRTINDLNIKKMGFEYEKLDVMKYNKLNSMVKNLKGFEKIFINMRKTKNNFELDKIRKACDIASNAFNNFYKKIEIGMKESDLAAELTYEMRKSGAQKPVKGHFVVASGVRGQKPHGVFTNKVIENGDFITFDFGAVYKGYVSDITRTIGIGDVSNELKKIYDIVYEAQKLAISNASSKLTGNELDNIAREYIESKGYGEYFTHSTGHGIGLEIHELPMVNNTNQKTLPINSVITIEPGIYIPDFGGVRIEDNVIIKENNCEVISSAEKELIILD